MERQRPLKHAHRCERVCWERVRERGRCKQREGEIHTGRNGYREGEVVGEREGVGRGRGK